MSIKHTPDQGDERRAFEQHIEATEKRKPMLWSTAYANGNEVCPAPLEGVYFQVADQKAWLAWQAARALSAAQPVAQEAINQIMQLVDDYGHVCAASVTAPSVDAGDTSKEYKAIESALAAAIAKATGSEK